MNGRQEPRERRYLTLHQPCCDCNDCIAGRADSFAYLAEAPDGPVHLSTRSATQLAKALLAGGEQAK